MLQEAWGRFEWDRLIAEQHPALTSLKTGCKARLAELMGTERLRRGLQPAAANPLSAEEREAVQDVLGLV